MPARLMMFEVMPRKYIGMKLSTTEIGIVMIGTNADGMCQRKNRITRLTMIISMISSSFRLVDGFLDEVRAVVGRDDLHAFRQRRLQVLHLRLHALDHVERVLAVAHDHDAADRVAHAVEVADAAADLRAERDVRHVAQEDRRAAVAGLHHDLFEIARASSM